MNRTTFNLEGANGSRVHVYKWESVHPDIPTRGIIQIAHGMTETALRYERFAAELIQQGYIVYANDHRGHGKTASRPEQLGHMEKGDFMGMVHDMGQLSQYVQERHPNVPLVLFGHSMGSFLSQMYITKYGHLLHGLILSGSNGPRGLDLSAGVRVSQVIRALKGAAHRSEFINNLAFGGFNRSFKPSLTPFDWLSRDEQEVQKYIDDPMCGYVCTVGFYYEFFCFLKEVHHPSTLAKVPLKLPVLIVSGSQDPVGNFGKGLRKLKALYKQLGVQEVSLILYPGARHELLNETNRDEVTLDCIEWLNRLLPQS
ncbi:lysophospholipase [Paenibacillus sp. ACRRX]|uniref:alpha/beta hydrolase n=1 Tax=Paenibacillus sp. ACRRX TaxID=2918206 RepID=UPI001EF5AB8E|nr:alpha/beta hydrolase [Paenibacillus sp. ACRRX]MCG7408673.1 lysophospholipase [Paenibacillus sp. ACRRX]